jgi:hypothetical protein
MFVNNNDFINITVFYKKLKAHYIAYSKNDFENKISEEEKKKFSSVNIKMRTLTWGLYNQINESATTKEKEWNYRLYKENKLKSIIIDWDVKIKNEKGELVSVPVNQDSIMNMAPEVAEIILSEYDEIMSINDDEERKVMGQVHNFIMNGRGASTVARAIMENDLIEEHHWLPQDIANIPYKSLMMYYLIRRTKVGARDAKQQVEAIKKQENDRGKKASGHTAPRTPKRR